ncbi:MAG: biopolymer transporter ExbD [Solimicrobium sp.]|jgi:biopolymer transport protein ExbD|nr:biopolymer transporter ExbD [Solimicrobium sp.]
MNFRKGNSKGIAGRAEPEINLIPFIDVLLVILIFLMVTTTYSRFTELQINLPKAEAATVQQHPNEIQIGVDVHGNYKINEYPVARVNTADLAENIKKVVAEFLGSADSSEPVVIINADGAASHQSVIDILEAARLAGLSKITFAAQNHAR